MLYTSRTADTVAHTDTAIRRWLRGRFIDRPYKAPFQLVAYERSECQYRRLLKRCLFMWLRPWLMPRSLAKALTRRTITFKQDQALQKLWDDPVWSETSYTIGHVPHSAHGLRAAYRVPGAAFDRGAEFCWMLWRALLIRVVSSSESVSHFGEVGWKQSHCGGRGLPRVTRQLARPTTKYACTSARRNRGSPRPIPRPRTISIMPSGNVRLSFRSKREPNR